MCCQCIQVSLIHESHRQGSESACLASPLAKIQGSVVDHLSVLVKHCLLFFLLLLCISGFNFGLVHSLNQLVCHGFVQHLLILCCVHLAIDEASPEECEVLKDGAVLEGVTGFPTCQARLCDVKGFP